MSANDEPTGPLPVAPYSDKGARGCPSGRPSLAREGPATNIAQAGSYQLSWLLVVKQAELPASIDVSTSLVLLAVTGIGQVVVFSRRGTGKTVRVPDIYHHY